MKKPFLFTALTFGITASAMACALNCADWTDQPDVEPTPETIFRWQTAGGSFWRGFGKDGIEDKLPPDIVESIAKMIAQCRANESCQGIAVFALSSWRRAEKEEEKSK